MGEFGATDRLRHVSTACVRSEGGVKRVEVSSERICIRRTIAGLETWVNVPTQSYRGVALRAAADGMFEIALPHVDPGLDLVLARAPDDRDVIALWRRYGRMVGLPLLVEDMQGRLHAVPDAPEGVSSERRYGSPLKARRPRFLARRRSGAPGPACVHRGERDMFAMASCPG